MGRVLVVAEHDGQDLAVSCRHVVTAALATKAGDVDILITGNGCDGIADQAAHIVSVAKIRVVDHPLLADGLAEHVAMAIHHCSDAYSHVFAPASTFGKNVLPRAAALGDMQPISDIIAVDRPDVFRRPIYAGNAIETVQCADPILFVTVRATSFPPSEAGAKKCPIEKMDVVLDDSSLSRLVSREASGGSGPDLTSARVVISGGRAIESKENFALIEKVAKKLNAAIGASRAAVDAGFAPNDWQVGQTGKIVAPDLYIAVGISGAIQHLAGIKDAKVIVAINKDEEAPIFKVADYGMVADLFKVLPELAEKL